MTIVEKYSAEQNNTTSIHLYLEGTFWHVYERSAYLFFQHIKQYTVQRKEVKLLGRDLAHIGFPDSRLNELLQGHERVRHSETYVELRGFSPVDLQKFEAWKLSYPLNMSPERKKTRVEAPSPVAVNETAEVMLRKVQRFRLELSSPMDCFLFVQELKNMIIDD